MCERNREFSWESAWSSWFAPGMGRWEGRHGRRRGGPRFFGRGELKYAILRLIAEKPMHGYEVMQALERDFGGWYSASAGSVYPVLQMLTDQGLLESREEGGRRIYSLTPEGESFLASNAERADDVADRVAAFGARFGAGAAQETVGILLRLGRAVLETAMGSRPDGPELARVREILEAALREMEARPAADAGGAEQAPV